jgi:hypothetical protein
MRVNPYPRRAAAWLLAFAVRIAPPHAAEWGDALCNELRYVEGEWASLTWAIGGASFLGKQALFSIFTSGKRPTAPSGGGLFGEEDSMRKSAFAVACACAVASLLFFLAPTFRQAFAVSQAQWHVIFHQGELDPWQGHQAGVRELARKAEQERDAEALVFAAVRLEADEAQATRLAEKAVGLDPNLTWVYGFLWMSKSDLGQRLYQWDPQNALSYLIMAERIDIDEVNQRRIPHRPEDESQAWKEAMAGAFASPKLDTYLDRLMQLDRRVLARHGVGDMFQTLNSDYSWNLPSLAVSDASRYAEILIADGETLEARGKNDAAKEKYAAVVRFQTLMETAVHLERGLWVRRSVKQAYERLAEVSGKEGATEQADIFKFLSQEIERRNERARNQRHWWPPAGPSQWSATLAKAFGVTMLLSASLLLICTPVLLAKTRTLRPNAPQRHQDPSKTGVIAGASAIALFLSSVLLYLTYWPYAEIVHRFIQKGDTSELSELSQFLSSSRVPLGAQEFYGDFATHFWIGVTIVLAIALLCLAIRAVRSRRSIPATA